MKTLQMASGEKVETTAANALSLFLAQTHETLAFEKSGAVADYIPELLKTDPNYFGIALATIDGHVYEVGDAAVPFTIQSISKAFVFALRSKSSVPRGWQKRSGWNPAAMPSIPYD